MTFRPFARLIVAFAFAAPLGACGSMDALIPNKGGQASTPNQENPSQRTQSGVESHQGPVTEADKIKVLPLEATDLTCPLVDIADGGATQRVGGPDNQAVKYQIDISNVSRNCEPHGAQAAINIGVSGLGLVGPAGSPGVFSTDLKVLVISEADKKTFYQKSYKVSVDTKGSLRGTYELVLDPIMVPLTRTNLDDLYSITIGLANSVSTKPEGRPTPKPKKTPH